MVLAGRSPRGERNGYAKLTAEDVMAIRTLYAQGDITQRALGVAYGIDQSHVSLHRETEGMGSC